MPEIDHILQAERNTLRAVYNALAATLTPDALQKLMADLALKIVNRQLVRSEKAVSEQLIVLHNTNTNADR